MMSVADIADRFSILVLKNARSGVCAEELKEYVTAMWECLRNQSNTEEALFTFTAVCLLIEVNASIWDLEADIRAGKEGDLTREEVGTRALRIRDLNKKRIALKNNIAVVMRQPTETKINHASGD